MEPVKTFDADVIVIGTSIATQTVLLPLLKTNARILVLEGGDYELTPFGNNLTFSYERGHYINHHWGGHWLHFLLGIDSGIESRSGFPDLQMTLSARN